MDDFMLYEKIRNYTDEELEKFMEEFYWFAVSDGYNGNDPKYKDAWKSTMKILEKYAKLEF